MKLWHILLGIIVCLGVLLGQGVEGKSAQGDTSATYLPDDVIFSLGTNGGSLAAHDIAVVHRSTFLTSQTVLANVLLSWPGYTAQYHMPMIHPGSLIISSTQPGAGILLAMRDGTTYNSVPIMYASGQYADVRFGNYSGAREDETDQNKMVSVWTFGGLDMTAENGHYYVTTKKRSVAATGLVFNNMNFSETVAPYAGTVWASRSLARLDSSTTQNLTGSIIAVKADIDLNSFSNNPTVARADAITGYISGGTLGVSPTVTALSNLHLLAPTRSAGTWNTFTSLEIEAPGTPATTNRAIWSKGGRNTYVGPINSTPQILTVPAYGGGVARTTLTPTSSSVSIDCQDSDTCAVTMGEGSAISGDSVYITNTSANNVTFADTAGVSELAGAFTMGRFDSLTLRYVVDKWVEQGRSDN